MPKRLHFLHQLLKKKHNSIAYHHVREAIAANLLQVAWVETGKNLVDMLIKPLPGPCSKLISHHGFTLMVIRDVSWEQSYSSGHKTILYLTFCANVANSQ